MLRLAISRNGWHGQESGSRTVSSGRSCRTVSPPTMIASLSRRSCCTRRRASGPVIHLDSPSAVAILPSNVIAIFRITKGRPVVIHLKNGRLISPQAARSTPTVT